MSVGFHLRKCIFLIRDLGKMWTSSMGFPEKRAQKYNQNLGKIYQI